MDWLGKPHRAENSDLQTASAAPSIYAWSPSCYLDSAVLALAANLSASYSGSFLQKDPLSICSLPFLDAPSCSDTVWGRVHLLSSHKESCRNNRLRDTGGGTLAAPWGTNPKALASWRRVLFSQPPAWARGHCFARRLPASPRVLYAGQGMKPRRRVLHILRVAPARLNSTFVALACEPPHWPPLPSCNEPPHSSIGSSLCREPLPLGSQTHHHLLGGASPTASCLLLCRSLPFVKVTLSPV